MRRIGESLGFSEKGTRPGFQGAGGSGLAGWISGSCEGQGQRSGAWGLG